MVENMLRKLQMELLEVTRRVRSHEATVREIELGIEIGYDPENNNTRYLNIATGVLTRARTEAASISKQLKKDNSQ